LITFDEVAWESTEHALGRSKRATRGALIAGSPIAAIVAISWADLTIFAGTVDVETNVNGAHAGFQCLIELVVSKALLAHT